MKSLIHFPAAFLAAHLCTAGSLVGQAAPAPASPDSASTAKSGEEAPVELSPFTVTADQDVGYLAGNTLAGSRLNTKLKDTAASISVMTEEFLKDIGAHDISEALEFSNNLQIDRDDAGEFGDFPGGNAEIELPTTYRVRGLKATTARNGFEWKLSTDTYNVERVEDSRGPNSILFGIGSAGGVINVTTKQANVRKTQTKLQLGLGSYESWRGMVDHNHVLLGRKLGVRLAALWNRSNSHRHYAFTESRRFHLATKYQPTGNTQVRVEFQKDDIDQNAPRGAILQDYSVRWIAAGRPTFSAAEPVQFGARLLANQYRYIADTGQLLNLAGHILTTGSRNGWAIFDTNIADISINTGGPGQDRRNDSQALSAFLQQKLGEKSFLELAFNHQEYVWRSYDPQFSNRLYGDPNRDLPGTLGANPFAGRSFLETWWRIFDRAESTDAGRVTFATEFNAKKWGLYRMAALGEYEKRRYYQENFWEVFDGRPFNATLPAANANRVIRRSYITTGDWRSYYVEGPTQTGLLKGVTDPISGRAFSSHWSKDEARDNPAAQKGALVTLQAIYFDGRLVVGTGARQDKVDFTTRAKKRDPVTLEYEVDYTDVRRLKAEGSTYTMGIVAHPTKHISLLYNQANNYGLPDERIRILPDINIAPGAEGQGRDYGVAVTLFDGKIYARAVRFETASRGTTAFSLAGGDGYVGTSNAILGGLSSANLITPAEFDARNISLGSGSTSDREAEGYEFQLTANPTSSWRVQANWSLTEGAQTNIGLEVREWWAKAKPYFQSFPQDTPTSGGRTIADEIREHDEFMANALSVEGLGTVGNRKLKANFVTRYRFTSGLLKGAHVGGGYRYQGKMLIGRMPATNEVLYGKPFGEAMLLAGFSVPVAKRRMNVQLNVSNLFDETDHIITRKNQGDGLPRTFTTRAPRAWRITTDYSF